MGMSYDVGTHIDLSHMNDRTESSFQHALSEPKQYEVGTVFSFLKMAKGMIVVNITEPPIALRVAVGA